MKQILLYGSSIFMAGLAARLQREPGLQVRCQAVGPGLVDLGGIQTVVVDLDDADASEVLAIIRARPDLRVVGVNTSSRAFTVLSGHVYLAQSLDDVATYLAARNEPVGG